MKAGAKAFLDRVGIKKPMMMKRKRKMTQVQDDMYDKKHNIKEGSKRDMMQDMMNGIKDKKKRMKKGGKK